MINVTKLSRIIKAIQGLLFVILGIIFCIFFNNKNLHSAIGYCVATVVLIYGVLTIAFSYLFQRGIASTDTISGVIMSSLSIFIYARPDIVTQFLPLFFSTLLIIYSILFLIEIIIYSLNKKLVKRVIKIIIYIIMALFTLSSGISILIFSIQKGNSLSDALVLVIGVIIIIIGLLLTIFALISPKQPVLVTNSSVVNGEKLEQINLPQNVENHAKSMKNSKNKKSSSKTNIDKKEDNIKQIDNKSLND